MKIVILTRWRRFWEWLSVFFYQFSDNKCAIFFKITFISITNVFAFSFFVVCRFDSENSFGELFRIWSVSITIFRIKFVLKAARVDKQMDFHIAIIVLLVVSLLTDGKKTRTKLCDRMNARADTSKPFSTFSFTHKSRISNWFRCDRTGEYFFFLTRATHFVSAIFKLIATSYFSYIGYFNFTPIERKLYFFYFDSESHKKVKKNHNFFFVSQFLIAVAFELMWRVH